VRAAEDGRTGPLPTLGQAIARPFAGAAERSSTVSKTGDGQSRMRTERVTLELTGAPGWRVHVQGIDVESVRVVQETHCDDLAQVAMERDAAIRERDALRASVITQSLTADRFAAAVSEADTLRARVDELEAASGGGEGEKQEFLWCDGCGVSFACDESSGGKRTLVEPDNAFGGEQWENLCQYCASLESTTESAQAATGGGEGEP
jgi:hypothetical protein